MTRERTASIDATTLYKGQSLPPELVWNYFVVRRQDRYQSWLLEYGDEATAKAAKISLVLQQVMQWLERDRNRANLPPLVMNTTGGFINVLTDDKASEYLNSQAFSGLRRHQRAIGRLMTAVDESQMSGAARREHQNRINVHSFIAASAQGAQKQLRLLKQAGKTAPRLEGL